MVRVIDASAEQLRARVDELLNRLGMSREEADRAAEDGLLEGRDYWTYEEIRSIDFLLNDEIHG